MKSRMKMAFRDKFFPDPENGGLFPSIMNIAVEDLKNPQTAHVASLWRIMLMRKNKQMRHDFWFWMLDEVEKPGFWSWEKSKQKHAV